MNKRELKNRQKIIRLANKKLEKRDFGFLYNWHDVLQKIGILLMIDNNFMYYAHPIHYYDIAVKYLKFEEKINKGAKNGKSK